ncbi:MAG: 16S rRNA (cytosine(1402)-N(4))-methyltransferase RsmH [Fimbriimonadaceae bacterium]|nr:16S rRNA (cytosine(1402)-N(4))-methyltransferase RsmH [Fimbriimonadaceae bacterium]
MRVSLALAPIRPIVLRRSAPVPIAPTHVPVMATEVLDLLGASPGDVVVDGTIGLGGHSALLCERIGPKGTLIGFDWDAAMLSRAAERLRASATDSGDLSGLRYAAASEGGGHLWLVNADYREIPEALAALGCAGADAILLDLGLNSAQLDDAERGLSFNADGPLDMRMDRDRREPASALLNRLAPGQIETMLQDLGDERWARAIAKAICDRRRERPLQTTQDLVDCVLRAIPPRARDKRIHPATRTFQAVRIAVNQELEGLEGALVRIGRVLNPGGTMVTLAYHSGEDRAAKRAFLTLADGDFDIITRKPLEATEAERAANPRSRSAKLRALRRRPQFGASST